MPHRPPPVEPPADNDPLSASADLSSSDLPPREPRLPGDATTREPVTLVAVALGGAAGALVRYEVALAVPAAANGFPWSTLLINLTGAAFLGVFLTVLTERRPPTPYLRPLLGTGFAGGYTTWSTFMVDTDLLVHHHHPLVAVAYVAATLVGGIGLLTVAVGATRRVAGVPSSPPPGAGRRR